MSDYREAAEVVEKPKRRVWKKKASPISEFLDLHDWTYELGLSEDQRRELVNRIRRVVQI